MRIFLSCLQSDARHDVPAYGFWESYFKNGLEETGHEWIEAKDVDWAQGLAAGGNGELDAWRDRAWSKTLAHIKKVQQTQSIDLFLSYLFPKQVEPTAIREIQSWDIPCVNFFCDNVREFTRIPDVYGCFDLHWVPEFEALEMYEEAGLDYVHAPMPCWIPPEQRVCNHPEDYAPTFIGSRDALRERLFADALKQDATVDLRGPGWISNGTEGESSSTFRSVIKRLPQMIANQIQLVGEEGLGGLLNKFSYRFRPNVDERLFRGVVHEGAFGEDYVRITQQSQITLGVNRYPSFRHSFSNPGTYSRLRDIEAPMMGACYLTEWTEGLNRLYDLGREIETYRTAEELVGKIEELRQRPEKRKQMRCAAQRRALSEHTIGASLQSLTERLGVG